MVNKLALMGRCPGLSYFAPLGLTVGPNSRPIWGESSKLLPKLGQRSSLLALDPGDIIHSACKARVTLNFPEATAPGALSGKLEIVDAVGRDSGLG